MSTRLLRAGLLLVLAPLFALASAGTSQPAQAGNTIDGQFTDLGMRAAGVTTVLPVAGRGGVPGDAAAVTLNVTSTGSLAAGFVTVYPCGAPRPDASNLNFGPGATIANAVTSKVGAGGAVCIYNQSATHLIVDVNGYFPPGFGFGSLVPSRLLDTRPVANPGPGAEALALELVNDLRVSRGLAPVAVDAALTAWYAWRWVTP